MNITISSPHLVITSALEEQVKKKFTHISKMFDRIESCDVLLKKEENDKWKKYIAEARLLVPGKTLFATERAKTFEIALDELVDDIKQQLRRYKVEHA
jgi:putative sigma-54 modulation protein